MLDRYSRLVSIDQAGISKPICMYLQLKKQLAHKTNNAALDQDQLPRRGAKVFHEWHDAK